MSLNDRMSFDHIIRVHDDGRVTDEPNLYAPSLMDEEIEDADWEFFSTGYTGQHGYNGPIMHNSEFIGGRLEKDILETPGVYVAVIANWTPEDEAEKEIEDYYSEGWAILRMKEGS